jgi:uncharacterized protein
MSQETVDSIIRWQQAVDQDERLEITFHGGEPLVPGIHFYLKALSRLHEGLRFRNVRFAMQSNLWLLTDELADLLKEYKVSIGTSLDGPEAINDAQRGKGYFRRTMAGIEKARAHSLDVGCICTFTRQSLPHMQEILDFFIYEGLNFTLHPALPALRSERRDMPDHWSLSTDQHAELIVKMLDLYLVNSSRVRITNLDAICRSLTAGQGGICTFGDCLGSFLAVGPDGSIYPCQRFAGMTAFSLGNVHAEPTPDKLSANPTWKNFQARQLRITEECKGCLYLEICSGGCPYNALVEDGEVFKQLRDPHCNAYQQTFEHITKLAMAEVFSQENMAVVVDTPDSARGLLQKGHLLSLMRSGPHPYETAAHARLILASVVLASTASPEQATHTFAQLGLVTRQERTLAGMQSLHQRLTSSVRGLNNLYIHVTFACPLHCTHCYAQAGLPNREAMPVDVLATACRDGSALGFRHVVITGGEPLVHPQIDLLLDTLATLRKELKPLLTVLRTSLSLPIEDALLYRIASSTDEVVVSLDGDHNSHDERRGQGSYDLVVSNLRRLLAIGGNSEISLAAVLSLQQVNGSAGESVRILAKELGIRRTRFRPLLPLGRAISAKMDIVPETLWGYIDPNQILTNGFKPVNSCGLGQNLYVEPDGKAYPCYAWHNKEWILGSLVDPGGLHQILASTAFRGLRKHTVDSNQGCRTCDLRYICGGACRAWNQQTQGQLTNLDAAPLNCDPLRARAHSLFLSALTRLGISEKDWQEAGLPALCK